MNNEYKALYEAVSNKFSIGTFEEFEARMQSPEDRKRFYDAVSKKGFSLGGYDEYEERLKKKEASTESQSTGAQESTPSASESKEAVAPSNVPVPATIKESMERFKETGKVAEDPALGSKAAEKPEKKAEGSSVVIDAIFTEEAAKGREAQDAFLEHDRYVNKTRDESGNFKTQSVEDISYSEKQAIKKAGEALGVDFTGRSYEEVKGIVDSGKQYSEQVLFENTLEKAKEEEMKDPTVFGLTRTAFFDGIIGNPARNQAIRAAAARGDYATVENMQQEINLRTARTQLALGIDPTDSKGITETWKEGDVDGAIYKGLFGAAGSAGGLILTIAAPTVGLAYFGETSYTSTYAQNVDRGDLTWEEKESLALIAGATEIVVGKFMGGLNNVKRFRGAMGISDDIGKASIKSQRAAYNKAMDFLEPYGKKFVGAMRTPAARGVTRTVYDTGSEAFEEGFVDIVNQVAAHGIAGDDFDVYSIYDSMILGAAMGGPMAVGTGISNVKAIASVYKRPLAEDVENYETLQAQYKDLKQAAKEESDPAKKKIIGELAQEVRQEIKVLQDKATDTYNKLSDKDAVALYNAHKNIEKLSRQAKETTDKTVKKRLGNKIAGLLVQKGELEAKAGIKAEVDQTVDPTGATEITAADAREQDAGDFTEIARKQKEERDAADKRLSPDDTPRKIVNKRGRYLNPADNTLVEGVVAKDGQTLVLETDEGNIIEIGNFNELADTPLRELGLSDAKGVVSPNEDGSFTYNSVAGAAPQGTKMVPSQGNVKSVRRDKKGNIKRVVMKSPDGGTTYNLTGQDAQDMAYQLYLSEMATEEGAAKVESEIEKDEEARRILEAAEKAKPSEPTTEAPKKQAARDTGKSAKQGVEAPQAGVSAVGFELDSKTKAALNKIKTVLSLIVPDLKIVVHQNRDSYNDTYDGAKRTKGHFNPNTNTIHILADGKSVLGKDVQTLIRHEAIHPVLDALLQYSPEATARAAASVRSILARMKNNPNAKAVEAHAGKYKGKSQEIQDLELVTEFLAVFSDSSAIEAAKKSEPSFLERIADLLTRLLRTTGLIDAKTKLEGEKEIKALMNALEFSFTTGKAFTTNRHKNIVDSKKKQIRESIDNIGKEPYAPKKGESLEDIIKGLDNSKSNFIKAVDFEHSLELRRLGFFESHQLPDGSILLGKGVRYETYDAANNVAKIHPKSFISKDSIKGNKKKVADTLTAFAKFIKADVKFIDSPELPFTSTLIIPDADNKLKSPTPVVNLAYANARTGAAGFSTFIVEAIKTASPVAINEAIARMDSKSNALHDAYKRYENTYTKLDITRGLPKEDIQFMAFSRVLQESIDRVLTGAISNSYTDFASDMQQAFSDFVTEKAEQPSAKDRKGEYFVKLMPFGEDFIPTLKNLFIDKGILFQESVLRGKESAQKIIQNLAEIMSDSSADEGSISMKKKGLKMIYGQESNRLNVIDWIAIHTMGDFNHPAVKMLLQGNGLPSILESYEYVADQLGEFYVQLSDIVYGDMLSNRKIEKAFFEGNDKGLTESEKAVLGLIKSYVDSMYSDVQKEANLDYENKVFKQMLLNFVTDVAGGQHFDDVAKYLGIEEGIIQTSHLNESNMDLIRELGVGALGGTPEGFADVFSNFLQDNVAEKANDVLPLLLDMVQAADSKSVQKIKEFKSVKQALDYAINQIGVVSAGEAFVKKIPFSEIKGKVDSIFKNGLPKGSESTIFSKDSELQISVTPSTDGTVEVSYGFIYTDSKGFRVIEYADYPNNWKLGSITMPLVFESVAQIGALVNAKAITFMAVSNKPSDNVDLSLYDESQREQFARKEDSRVKRRGLNNQIALRNGKIISAKTKGTVSFFFEDEANNNVLYTTSDERITSMVSNIATEGLFQNGAEIGQKIKAKKELYDLVKKQANDPKNKTTKKETFSKEGSYLAKMYNQAETLNSESYVFIEAESIENTGVLASTSDNSVKYIAPAVIRESLSDEGPSGEEAARAVDNMFEEAERHIIESGKSKKWSWKRLTSRTSWVDRSSDMKKAMASGFSKYIMSLNVNRAGATSYADRRFQKIRKSIYGKITNSEREQLDKYIYMRRVIDIDSTWIKRRGYFESRVNEEQNQIAYYQNELAEAKSKGDKKLSEEIENDIKESKDKLKYFESQLEKYSTMPKHPSYDGLEMNKQAAERAIEEYKNTLPAETMALIENRAENYFDAYRQILEDHYKAGLIDLDTKNRFINNDYSPRVFLEKMFGNVDEMVLQQNGSFSRAQIQSIRSGSDAGIFTDTEYLLDISLRALENKKAKNKLFKEMHREARAKNFNIANGQFIREGNFKKTKDGKVKQDGFGNYQYEAADPNFKNVFYRENGKLRAFQIHKDHYDNLVGIKGTNMSPRMRRAVKWVSGSQIVKATATALNPFFAITGTLRGFKEVTRGRGVYDKYRFLPIMNAMVFIDFVKSSRDAVSKNSELVEEYYAHGGGLSFMTTQGKPDKLYKKKQKLGIDFLQRRGISLNPFSALAYAGEKAELALRLAIYQRTKQNLAESMPDATQDQINTMAAAEARLIADFAQSGELSSEVDLVIPYFNAAIQGTRASYDYMRENPKKFWSKTIQAYSLNTALAMFGRMMLWDDEEDKDMYSNISPWIVERYNIIPTGLKNSVGEHITIRIPKVHQFLMFDSLSEITAKHMTYLMKGKEVPQDDLNPDGDAWFFLDSILSSFPAGQFVPLTEIRKGKGVLNGLGQRMFGAVPIASSIIAYAGNYDLFRDKIIAYDKGEVLPFAEGYKDANTHDIYKFFGDITAGLERESISPKRAEVAIEKLIGSESTLLTALLYQMTDKFLTVKEEKRGITPEKANKEFKNLFGFGKSFIYTIPKDAWREKKDIAELTNMRAVTEVSMIRKDIRLAADKYSLDELRAMGEKGKLPTEVTDFINDLDEPQVMKRYYLQYFKRVSLGNAVDDDKYFEIKFAKTPKAEMQLFMHYFGDPAELSPEDRQEIQTNLSLIGYNFSEQTKAYYSKLKQK